MLTEITGRQQKRYILRDSQQARVEVDVRTSEEQAQGLLDAAKGFFLPRGYPATVTPDYLRFQLWAVPAHVTGWMSNSLATSSLLKAVGVGSGSAEGAAASAAAIKWITKDGIGAAGRVLVGGKLGNVFDEDPKRWRMVAEAFLSLGLALEIATSFSPGNFIALAGAGNLSRAVGRGMTNPCFRIIQTHFAVANNIGDVAAKEEVWEVSAQLLGLALSVVLLRAIEATGRPENVLGVWAAVQVGIASSKSTSNTAQVALLMALVLCRWRMLCCGTKAWRCCNLRASTRSGRACWHSSTWRASPLHVRIYSTVIGFLVLTPESFL